MTQSYRVKRQQNKSRNFENMVLSNLKTQRPDCRIQSFYTTTTQKKTDFFKVDRFCAHCNTVFEAISCYYQYYHSQEARRSLTDEGIERGSKKRERDWSRKQYIKEK